MSEQVDRLLKLVREFPKPPRQEIILVDPLTFEQLREISEAKDLGMIPLNMIGSKLKEFDFGDRFVPPYDRFVEYEESDHGWLERLGFGSRKPIAMAASVDASLPFWPYTPGELLHD